MPKLSPLQLRVTIWAGLGVVGIAGVYVVMKYVLPKVFSSATDSVAGAPATVVNSLTKGAASLTVAVDGFFAPLGDWWDSITGKNTEQLVSLPNAPLVDPVTNFGAINPNTWDSDS